MSTPLIILLVIANLISIYYAIIWLPQTQSRPRSLLKIAPMILLIISGFIGGIPILISLGLLACVIGDYFLSLESEKNFLLGLSAFLVGHLFYIGFFAAGFKFAYLYESVAIETGIVLLALIALVLLRIWPHLKEMTAPVCIYALVIAAMAFFAKLAEPGFLILAGIVLFVISDVILANDRFTPLTNSVTRKIMPYGVWILYFVGQSLIVFGFLYSI